MLLSPRELYELVKIDNIYFQTTGGGICFGGGEPTLYRDFILEFKKLCGDRWKITLETCLVCSMKTLESLSSVVDHWIVDIKSMNSSIYEAYTGKLSEIEQHLQALSEIVKNEHITIKVL